MTDKLIPSFEEQLIIEETEIKEQETEFTTKSIEPSTSQQDSSSPIRPSSPGSSSKLRKRIKELEKQVEFLNKELKLYKDKFGELKESDLTDEQYNKLVQKFYDNSPYLSKFNNQTWGTNKIFFCFFSSLDKLIYEVNTKNSLDGNIRFCLSNLCDKDTILIYFSNYFSKQVSFSIVHLFCKEKDDIIKEKTKQFLFPKINHNCGTIGVRGSGILVENHNPKKSLIYFIGGLEECIKNKKDNDLGSKTSPNDWPRSYETLSNLYDQYLKEIKE